MKCLSVEITYLRCIHSCAGEGVNEGTGEPGKDIGVGNESPSDPCLFETRDGVAMRRPSWVSRASVVWGEEEGEGDSLRHVLSYQ
jgi:hypothetical protein